MWTLSYPGSYVSYHTVNLNFPMNCEHKFGWAQGTLSSRGVSGQDGRLAILGEGRGEKGEASIDVMTENWQLSMYRQTGGRSSSGNLQKDRIDYTSSICLLATIGKGRRTWAHAD